MDTIKTPRKTVQKSASEAVQSFVQSSDLSQVVEVRAYFLSQQAGFEAGRELDFWLQAESETLASLAPAKPKAVRKPRVKKED